MREKYRLSELKNLRIEIQKPCLIFIWGDLGAGKTTLTKHIVNDILGIDREVVSPTYTYYNKYDDVFHFDLYRLKKYDEFFAIGGEDILDNNNGVVIVEWPEKIEHIYKPDINITLGSADAFDERYIDIGYNGQ